MNASGDLSTIKSVAYSWPSAQAAGAGYVLSNNGAGTLSWTAASAGTVTGIATGTGLSGGTITSSGTLSLANSGVAAGSYVRANVVVDATGRITTASAGAAIVDADIATGAAIAESKIANLTADLAAREPSITAGTATQYWRGDKSWQTLSTASVAESTNLY